MKKKYNVNLVRCEQYSMPPIEAESYEEAERIAREKYDAGEYEDEMCYKGATCSWDNHLELCEEDSCDDWTFHPVDDTPMVWGKKGGCEACPVC